MDKIFGSQRFQDVDGPDLSEEPAVTLTNCQHPPRIALPYLQPRPNRGQIRYLSLLANQIALHTVIVGAIGTGKTNLFCHLIRNIQGSMASPRVPGP